MTSPASLPTVNQLVIKGLILGYLYSIVLSAGAIITCEAKRSGECQEVWNQGFSISTGLVTTFLAYLIPPGSSTTTRRPTKKEEEDASA